MKIPAITGIIRRRLLVNYRVRPALVDSLLPAPFRPQLVDGWAIAGICQVRLENIRLKGLPAALGFASENAAHRIAVEWDDGGKVQRGVYVARRDSDSRLNTLFGGRLFPGVQHHARFRVHDHGGHVAIHASAHDDAVDLAIIGRDATAFPCDSVFKSLSAASRFFEEGRIAYSSCPGGLEGLRLRCHGWRVTPFEVEAARSTFFDVLSQSDSSQVCFDCALIMRDVLHEWESVSLLPAPTGYAISAACAI